MILINLNGVKRFFLQYFQNANNNLSLVRQLIDLNSLIQKWFNIVNDYCPQNGTFEVLVRLPSNYTRMDLQTLSCKDWLDKECELPHRLLFPSIDPLSGLFEIFSLEFYNSNDTVLKVRSDIHIPMHPVPFKS